MLFQQVICKKRTRIVGLSHVIFGILAFLSSGLFTVRAAEPLSEPNSPANTAAELDTQSISTIKAMLGQKIVLDFRYFCEDNTPSSRCRTPMTDIPQPLLNVLSTHNIGGVILFSENIVNAEQLIRLNYTMQQHMVKAGRQPLFIAVDQEGGRVARLPSDMLSPFAGNMAIGATFHQRGSAFAQSVASHIGQTLLPLGINTNFAPSVDVNSEPQNPVINVRSFSENPEQVAALGQAFVGALQGAGVIGAIKHFPGHGDTHVDSHSGLPQVQHTKAQAMKGDVLPFANIINSATPPAMVMSAHIQYPSLDSSTIIDKHGKPQIVPATLSKNILTNLLRNQLGYQGLIVSDALDMAGITQFFSHEEALLRAYNAGVDIALMPFTIRNQDDINAFEKLLNSVAMKTAKGMSNSNFGLAIESAFLQTSHRRIIYTKQRFALQKFVSKPVAWWLNEAKENGEAENANSLKSRGIQIEKALSKASVSVLYGKNKLPVKASRWLALMPDAARCLAFETALTRTMANANGKPFEFACLPLTALPKTQLALGLLKQADVLVVGSISPLHANYELGGFDQKEHVKARATEAEIMAFSKKIMTTARSQRKTVVFAPLRMPYNATEVSGFADIAIATFSYAININGTGNQDAEQETKKVVSHSLNALAEVLVGNLTPEGRSPVSIK
ncbi:glycoside hydrolase family 3 N-terminal domain-containing protein [Alteromonas gracilis]|uniref:glycoside hydrolase family 3 N-terminal domain-containing protein n=1 Tax=Alteromonas gracilis TaxID=1479524 RepID=UPI003735548B